LRVVWTFVCCVTAIDVAFAIANCGTLEMWEANPAQNWLATHYGVWACVAFRVGTLAFAWAIVPRARPVWRAAAEAIILAVHAYLLCVYLAIFIGA
jgi:hypothetical protein